MDARNRAHGCVRRPATGGSQEMIVMARGHDPMQKISRPDARIVAVENIITVVANT